MLHIKIGNAIKPFLWLIILIVPFKIHAQTDSTAIKNTTKPHIIISGYVDAYYAYYTDSVASDAYQLFPSVSPRSNQFGLNTAMLSASYDAERVRAVATFQYGDIPRSTWSSTFNNIMEAHAGVRLCKKLWVDAGFFRTHFGTEGLLPKENIASSISVNTFYEPYYESGVRLNYNPNDKLTINLYVLNGYNMFEDNNDKKSFGALVTYSFGGNGNIGYSNYIGDDTPKGDSVTHLRINQNLFFNYQLNKLQIQLGGDFCLQQHSTLDSIPGTATMYSGVLASKYEIVKQFSLYARGELFQDDDGFMSGVLVDNHMHLSGLKLWGLTLGAEYKINDDAYVRLEGRQLQTDNQEIFHWNNSDQSQRFEMMLHAGVSF